MKAAVIMGSFALVVAALAIAPPAGSVAYAPLPIQEQQVGKVTYLTGGVGRSEVAVMRANAKDYLLELIFSQKIQGQRDEFIADVKVQIQDEQENVVLDIVSEGPFLLANLPEGNYLVIVEFNGEVKQKKVTIAIDKHQKIEFSWVVLKPPAAEELPAVDDMQNNSLGRTVIGTYNMKSLSFMV
jgi:hypothetical protein